METVKESQNEQNELESKLSRARQSLERQLDALQTQIDELRRALFSELNLPSLTPKDDSQDRKQNKTALESLRNVPKKPKSKAGAKPKDSTLVFRAYAEEFFRRYGVEPLRNSTTNSQLKQFIRRVGQTDAMEVARFYVQYNDSFYVKLMHPVGMLLKDAETLHARWRSGHFVSTEQAKKVERTQANINASQAYLNKKYGKELNESKRKSPRT